MSSMQAFRHISLPSGKFYIQIIIDHYIRSVNRILIFKPDIGLLFNIVGLGNCNHWGQTRDDLSPNGPVFVVAKLVPLVQMIHVDANACVAIRIEMNPMFKILVYEKARIFVPTPGNIAHVVPMMGNDRWPGISSNGFTC